MSHAGLELNLKHSHEVDELHCDFKAAPNIPASLVPSTAPVEFPPLVCGQDSRPDGFHTDG